MNSINEIAKYKYEFNNNSPVNLDEYILLYDEALNEKYLLFKLYNGISEKLKHAECRVKVYNENNFLIEEIKFSFDGEYDGSNYFIPENKLKVESDIVSIKFDVLYLEFETLKYVDGEIQRIPKTMADFIPEAEPEKQVVVKGNKWTKKKDKLVYKSTKKKVKQDNKRRYVTDVSKQNKTKIHIIWTVIFSVIVVGYFVASMILYRMTAKVSSDQYNDYMLSGGAYTLVDNYNAASRINVPAKIDNTNVTKIAAEAFKNKTTIREITLNYYVEIGDSAFEGCTNLTTINNPNYITKIGNNAFSGTKINTTHFDNCGGTLGANAFSNNNITELHVKNATLDTNSLAGCNLITSLEYKDIAASKSLKQVFGDQTRSTTTLSTITTYSDISYTAFEGFNGINKINLFGDNTSLRSSLIDNGRITYLRVNAGGKTLYERLGNRYSIQNIHVNLSSSYTERFMSDISGNTLIIDGGNLNTQLITNAGRFQTLYICSNVNYSYVDFDKILQYGNIYQIIFEGDVPQSLKYNYNIRGNISRSAFGVDK